MPLGSKRPQTMSMSFSPTSSASVSSSSPSSNTPTSRRHDRTLYKMIEAAASGRHGCTWSHILQYLKANSIIDNSTTGGEREFRFETPLATYYVASASLAQELSYQQYAVFRSALAALAPKRILAALCQLAPQAPRTHDAHGRLPLHSVCRYPPTDAVHVALQILIPAYPEGLTHQDEHGRTPFHYMFQYHADKRSTETVALFLQKHWWPTHNGNTTNNPCLVPDTVYGALPLHYAVAGRASTAVIQALVTAAPTTKHAVDTTFGRTPLHWYVGRFPTTATGEDASTPDASIPSVATMHHLLSSRTVRTVDAMERTCLHDACAAAALQATVTADWGGVIAALLDVHVGQLTAQDNNGQTPLMVLLDTAAQQQQYAWQAQSSNTTTTTTSSSFTVPWLHFLFKNEMSLQLQDKTGRLPLHAAVACGLDPSLIEFIIQRHPASLLHVNEQLQVPLHVAFSEPWTASLQTAESVRNLVTAPSSWELVDGRVAMKMEDMDGSTPLHYACTHAASAACIQLLLEYYPQAACTPNPVGDLPLHCCVFSEVRTNHSDEEMIPMIQALMTPLLLSPSTTLGVADSRYGMMPLHILVLFKQAARYELILKVLELYPEAASHYSTNMPPSFATDQEQCSPLDLHEFLFRRDSKKDADYADYYAIRELLYSFHPTVASHRHRKELLDQCVHTIVQEVTGNGSVHQDRHPEEDALILTHTVSNMEQAYRSQSRVRTPTSSTVLTPTTATATTPTARGGGRRRPQQARPLASRRTRRQQQPRSPRISFSSSGGGVRSSSVYDDDDTGLDDYTMTGSSGSSRSSSMDSDEEYSTQYTTGGGTGTERDDESTYSSGSGGSSEDYSTTLGEDGDPSRSLYSGNTSRLPTTFEEDDGGSRISFLRSDPTSFEDSLLMRGGEEKKEESGSSRKLSSTGHPQKRPAVSFVRPSFMSEVSMRLWTFFVLYRDPNNPNDNYVQQLGEVVEAIDYPTLEMLVTHPVPPYAKEYLDSDQTIEGVSFGDLASPKCRELILKTCFFLGRYDFREANSNALIHNGWKETSVLLEWTEWIFTTEEKQNAATPGMAEKNIWDTGEMPAEVGLTFRKQERPVWILFTKNRAEYETELWVRRKLGIPIQDITRPPLEENDTCIVSVLNYFNAQESERKDDRLYHSHIRDPRFRTVVTGRTEIQLTDYPFAIVFEKPRQGTLAESIRRCGVPSPLDRVQIAFDVATALEHLHANGLYNGDISLHNVAMCDADGGSFSVLRTSMVLTDPGEHLGGVDEHGFARFRTGTLPPEMFASVSPSELKHFRSYWQTIRDEYACQVDERIVSPIINFETGEARVVRCHFIPQTNKQEIDLAPPYELQRPSHGNDFWAFGQLLFTVLTGRQLLNRDERLGYIEEFGGSFRQATAAVYEYVDDPIAKDLLLRCIGSAEIREELSVQTILNHPFFATKDKRSNHASKLFERRMHETASHSRHLLQKMNDLHGKKLEENSTVKVQCWDIRLLERFCFSPTQIFVNSVSTAPKSDILYPCSLILLPHNINDNISSQESLEAAEQVGLRLLELSKACFFTCVMEQATKSGGSRPNKHVWSTQETMRVLDFSSEEFRDIQAGLGEFAAQHVEAFRDSPASIAAMVVEKRVRELLKCYEDRTIYVYHVDELTNELLTDNPVKVTGWAKGLSGLVQLLFPSGFQATPKSWEKVAAGMNHELDDGAFLNELEVLEAAAENVCSGAECNFLSTIGAFWELFDPTDNRFAGLKRVEANGAVLWTRRLDILEDNKVTMSAALKDYRRLTKLES